jgi:hypothetical protein
VELITRADLELGEHFVEVVLDRARADEELRADLGVRVAFARKFGDLRLLRDELTRPAARISRTRVSSKPRSDEGQTRRGCWTREPG